ncbi:MAG: hypothetical protein AAGK79_02450 [Pseudomonadota bacterium]
MFNLKRFAASLFQAKVINVFACVFERRPSYRLVRVPVRRNTTPDPWQAPRKK